MSLASFSLPFIAQKAMTCLLVCVDCDHNLSIGKYGSYMSVLLLPAYLHATSKRSMGLVVAAAAEFSTFRILLASNLLICPSSGLSAIA